MPDTLLIWSEQNASLLFGVVIASILLLLLTLLATPFLLARMPDNYFVQTPNDKPRTPIRMLIATIRTVLGVLLIITGILMFVTPGPGLVALVMGVSLCEFPGKHRLLQRLVSQPSVFSTLNWLRAKVDKPPFLLPSPNKT